MECSPLEPYLPLRGGFLVSLLYRYSSRWHVSPSRLLDAEGTIRVRILCGKRVQQDSPLSLAEATCFPLNKNYHNYIWESKPSSFGRESVVFIARPLHLHDVVNRATITEWIDRFCISCFRVDTVRINWIRRSM